ncbi:TIGR02269 family lipoprotein [Myxococcus llanfairpwllgwyngyllgogerychwyrndrobwllllantysiliogogogochensis]|uniref:TIGR02269 family lipoprotein n=1 Tax=Myxococcus llanfairpwllgwyngyllgogerychwyrndrobwllllantysiliogogogochensis TaxID=2590453 RepID=A0A540WNR4_9BACT|nr:TIGR02269 family lipoprotein [Myxococcus llanfairpwllgwyngyllgogerychwyrndrobwllllantysiliogogogochensis]TQF10656.1 TIGR02269 family lipoprotein [Myxococcus llanfairpwllgwyngyllgogerychwyrndrobwllllantysiliogogogochensis]
MRVPCAFWLSLLVVSWLGCSTGGRPPLQQAWDEAEVECDDPEEDRCVTLLCLDDACGFYRCEDTPGAIVEARFPPSRPPAAAAAPGSGPRRNWGGAQNLPRGAVMTFPNWNGAPARIIPPSHQLTAGRWEKHHIFPQEQRLQDWFVRQGVKIHDYTMPIPRDLHQRIHNVGGHGGQWNEAWRVFIRSKPGASPEEIFKHAGELIYRFQLIGGPIRPYYSKPGA